MKTDVIELDETEYGHERAKLIMAGNRVGSRIPDDVLLKMLNGNKITFKDYGTGGEKWEGKELEGLT